MLNINVKKDGYQIEFEGHADFDEKGKDIVCAAASQNFYTLAESLNRYDEALVYKYINSNPENEGDNPVIKCKPKPKFEANIQLMFWMTMNGLELLAEAYPDNIKINVV